MAWKNREEPETIKAREKFVREFVWDAENIQLVSTLPYSHNAVAADIVYEMFRALYEAETLTGNIFDSYDCPFLCGIAEQGFYPTGKQMVHIAKKMPKYVKVLESIIR